MRQYQLHSLSKLIERVDSGQIALSWTVDTLGVPVTALLAPSNEITQFQRSPMVKGSYLVRETLPTHLIAGENRILRQSFGEKYFYFGNNTKIETSVVKQ